MTTKAKKDYSQGKIYKIEPKCEHDVGDIYIGSTTKQYLSQRMSKHRSGYRQWKRGTITKVMSYELFDKYGIENCDIILIENVNALNYDELGSRESYYIKTLQNINKQIPLRTDMEYRKDNEEKIKEGKRNYRQINKERIKIRDHDYYEQNKEILQERQKEYNEKTKEARHEYSKQYYEENKSNVLEYQKQYREKNAQKIRDYKAIYSKMNKESISEKQKLAYLKKNQNKENNEII